ncbi:MAG: hypothetical protein ACO3DP_01320 [Candidatus Nanopelagicaceae bacterium]
MARSKRRSSQKSFRYFFLNEKIHKVIKLSRSKDEVIAWCYPDRKRVLYSYSLVNKNMGKAFTVAEAASILNKHKITLMDYILEGKVRVPQKIYSISDPDNKRWSKYMLSESDILDIHQHILDSGHSKEVPSKNELMALLKHNIILYTKTDSGFVPVWKAE